ncbi:hypothetical protein Dred_1224 [Desulforamulus reducens MI-1]|uniref:Uncharacterized protein n=1 Tax=Desulforamulus reducens (strain ATCC BAA-1160 / DSM 100696 / MI-1) TaxID=349161 RepID=A4J3V5_DESRM|nr:hypothetical protein [Desulforamulus reducens]ABO49758.1 hypothetical protein Dred_1224 [Desulforamulus reducens MI-1]
MIIQNNQDHPNEAISIDDKNPACLSVQPIAFPGGETQARVIDLTEFQGGPFRFYLDDDGALSTDLYKDHYWLLAEAILPDKQYDNVPTGQVDENDQEVTEMVERPLDLNKVDVTVFSLPEVA